jgi:GT2 family glycosyltransferase
VLATVSLYIPCHNAERYLAPVIEGALRQTHPPDELLVVYAESRDRTLEIAGRYPVRIIRQQGDGLAAARNTAFRSVRHELVAALDADCVPEPDWLEKLAPLMDDSAVGQVGGRLVETVLHSAPNRWREARMPQDWGTGRRVNPPFLFGCNTLTRKSAFEAAGGYDEKLRCGGEDCDISRRLVTKGFSAVYEPAAVVRHIRRDTLSSVMATFWRWNWTTSTSSPLSLRSVLGRAFRLHLTANLVEFAEQDLRARRYGLLWVDLMSSLYMPYLDFKAFRNTLAGNGRNAVRAGAGQ